MGHANDRHALRSFSVLAAIGGVLLMLWVPAAHAQYPPPRAIGLVCTPESLNPGRTVACRVTELRRQENVRVRAQVNPVILDEAMIATDDGELDFTFEAPDARGAVVTVSVTGEESRVATTRVLVLPAQASDRAQDAGPGRGLARTGFETLTMLLGGVLLIGLGGSAVAASRRRDRRRLDA